jgi:hypothetical protein
MTVFDNEIIPLAKKFRPLSTGKPTVLWQRCVGCVNDSCCVCLIKVWTLRDLGVDGRIYPIVYVVRYLIVVLFRTMEGNERTVNVKYLPRLGCNPRSVHVTYPRLQQRRVSKLVPINIVHVYSIVGSCYYLWWCHSDCSS